MQDGAAEFGREVTEDQEANAAAECNTAKQSQSRIAETTKDRDHHREWERRRC